MSAVSADAVSVDAILFSAGITSLSAGSASEQLEVALRALGVHAAPLDAVRASLLRERAIQALKAIGIESPARLVDSAIGTGRSDASDGAAGAAVLFPAVEPWATPVYGPDILSELEEIVGCFVVLSTEAAVAVALWILHTHAVDAAQITPRLAILSPTKRCGKSTMLKLLGALVRRPLAAANLTAAGLFRGIEAYEPTLLVDEADTFLDGREDLRGVLNPGTGRMKEVDRIVEGTVENAMRLQAEWRAEIRRGDRATAEVPRLTDYATSWLRSRLPALKASTAATYAEVLDSHVLPHLGDFFLDRLMDSDVREWQARLAGRFAAATVNGALVMLRMVMADALAEFGLPHDPTARIKRMPKRRRPDDDPNVLSAGELGKVMVQFRDTEPEHYPLALTLALTGIRYGEATALRWSDIDEVGGAIRIERAQWHGIVGETKTGNVRTVPLTAELAEVLRDRCRTARGAAGWVFANGDGGLLGPCALRFPLRRALARAGITKRVTVHGLRRTFNNLSRQVAGNIVTRAITGHVTEEMTEHYSHVDRAEKLRAADQVVALTGLRVPANDNSAATAPASGGSSGGLN